VPVEPGDTFVFDPDGTNQQHLWVVVATYMPEFETVYFAIIAFVSTVNGRTIEADRACILRKFDDDAHPYIHNDSYVVFGRMKVVECEKLPKASVHEPVCLELLQRIQRAAHSSKMTKKGMKEYIPKP
jgi:hypothetical protein